MKNPPTSKKYHYVYILECINDHYYTGYTTDIERRYQEHQKGSRKCRYTQSFPPKKLAALWCFDNKSAALKEEARIKNLPRKEKMKLIIKMD
ncbi:MAG: GIY-YIG nuclease family protein [Coxiellaceae bacterium]|nr:GIY-YIG nuclease family protein [Coxiellaceae bacterium]